MNINRISIIELILFEIVHVFAIYMLKFDFDALFVINILLTVVLFIFMKQQKKGNNKMNIVNYGLNIFFELLTLIFFLFLIAIAVDWIKIHFFTRLVISLYTFYFVNRNVRFKSLGNLIQKIDMQPSIKVYISNVIYYCIFLLTTRKVLIGSIMIEITFVLNIIFVHAYKCPFFYKIFKYDFKFCKIFED